MSADHVYRFDYRDAIDAHRELGADCTVVTTEVPLADAADHAVVEVGDDRVGDRLRLQAGRAAVHHGRHRDLRVPTRPSWSRPWSSCTASSPPTATRATRGSRTSGTTCSRAWSSDDRVVAHPLPGYWRDLGQPHKYLAAHRDALTDDLGVLGDPDWPILTRQPQRVPARVLDGGR